MGPIDRGTRVVYFFGALDQVSLPTSAPLTGGNSQQEESDRARLSRRELVLLIITILLLLFLFLFLWWRYLSESSEIAALGSRQQQYTALNTLQRGSSAATLGTSIAGQTVTPTDGSGTGAAGTTDVGTLAMETHYSSTEPRQ